MAIFEPGSIVGSISGSVGGAAFVNSRGSKVVRKPKRPTPTDSRRNSFVQTNLQFMIHKWQGFTDDNQSAWRTYARQHPLSNRLGISRQITGYQQYLKLNLWLQSVGETLIDVPPVSVPPPTMFNIEFVSTVFLGITMTFDSTAMASFSTGVFYGRQLFRSSVMKFNNSWRLLQLKNTIPPSPFSVDDIWENEFPLPVLGQALAIRFIPTNEDLGIVYPPVDSIIVTTA